MRVENFICRAGVQTANCEPLLEVIVDFSDRTHISCIRLSRRFFSRYCESVASSFVIRDQSGRDVAHSDSIGEPASVFTSSWRDQWQQRRDVVARPRLREAQRHAAGARQPAAQQRAKAHARAHGTRRQRQQRGRNADKSLQADGKAGACAGFFHSVGISANSGRSPAR